MKPQRFYGATSREVLRKVKEALGDDALIASNRAAGEGIEITALSAAALGAVERAAPAPVRAPAAAPLPARTAAEPAADGIVQQLMGELKAMKAAMQRELAGIAWSDLMRRDPAAGSVMQTLLESGFSPALARDILGGLRGQQDAAAVRRACLLYTSPSPRDS